MEDYLQNRFQFVETNRYNHSSRALRINTRTSLKLRLTLLHSAVFAKI